MSARQCRVGVLAHHLRPTQKAGGRVHPPYMNTSIGRLRFKQNPDQKLRRNSFSISPSADKGAAILLRADFLDAKKVAYSSWSTYMRKRLGEGMKAKSIQSERMATSSSSTSSLPTASRDQ